MSISVVYDETDILRALKSFVSHTNEDEIIKLLHPVFVTDSKLTQHLFKLLIGNKLPDVLPNGTLCKCNVNHITYNDSERKALLYAADSQGNITVTIEEFRGYNQWAEYEIKYKQSSGVFTTTYVSKDYLETIEEF